MKMKIVCSELNGRNIVLLFYYLLILIMGSLNNYTSK